MAVLDQLITDKFALYNGDCIEVMATLPAQSVHLSVYSPPFCGLYHYSSSERDLSNCDDYGQFFEHYAYVVKEIARLTLPGRMTCVHCMDTPTGNSGCDALIDFPGDIIRLHEKHGFDFIARHVIWKEPLQVRNRTMQKNLSHMTTVVDSANAGVASADQLLVFRKRGKNPIPIVHPTGFLDYPGDAKPPNETFRYRGFVGDQKQNKYSHWIWRQMASSIWGDIRLNRVLPYKDCRDPEDEKHVHPLQLDVIDRCVLLRSNPGETVLTPFMGVGSEVHSPLLMGRKAIGIELKPSYYRQAVKNAEDAANGIRREVENETLDFEADAA